MDSKYTNPGTNVPEQGPDEPRGDRGAGGKTWSPPTGEQGISNREGDEETGPDDADGLPDNTKQRVPS
jgi:hypothetical protein